MMNARAQPPACIVDAVPSRLRVRLDDLAPFLDDPERPITFSDLQAALGMGHHPTQKAIRLLRQVLLLDRCLSGSPPRPSYLLPTMTLKLLSPNKVSRLPRTKALECVNTGLDVAAAHNVAHRQSHVTSFGVTGALLDAGVQMCEFAEVEVSIQVVAKGAVAVEIDQLLRDLRRIGDRALRISLVLEQVPAP